MSCLLPQFKCQPDIFFIHFRVLHNQRHLFPHPSKSKVPICFQTQCILSTTSPTTLVTTVLDVEKLRLPSLEANSNAVAANRQWTYFGAVGPPTEERFGASLATETLTGDEAVIAAAAAEAVALARAAVKVAKDAALMVSKEISRKPKSKPAISSSADNNKSLWAQLTERERASIIGDSMTVETETEEKYSEQQLSKDTVDLEPTHEELKHLEEQLSQSIAVRSGRQTERKAKRTRAAAANVMPAKSDSTGRRKRASVQELDYSDPLRYLRATTSASRLLTATEEMQLSAGIQDLLKLEGLHDVLSERCGGSPTIVQWAAAAGVDQKELRRRLNYGILCKDKMIKSNIRLVISIAKNYQGAGMSLQDLVQEGCRGLVRGAEKFDASKGFKFSTYAHWWIKQAVRKSLSEQSRTIRLPFHMVEATYRVKEARKQLYSENGKHPDNKEVAEATGLSLKRLHSVLLAPKSTKSLDQKIGINENLKPSEVIADPEAETSEELLMKKFMREDLKKVLNTLSPREKQVVRWRFGLDDGRMKTLQEIGELMGVSRERIRQIELSAFRKLKNKKRTKHLMQYAITS